MSGHDREFGRETSGVLMSANFTTSVDHCVIWLATKLTMSDNLYKPCRCAMRQRKIWALRFLSAIMTQSWPLAMDRRGIDASRLICDQYHTSPLRATQRGTYQESRIWEWEVACFFLRNFVNVNRCVARALFWWCFNMLVRWQRWNQKISRSFSTVWDARDSNNVSSWWWVYRIL